MIYATRKFIQEYMYNTFLSNTPRKVCNNYYLQYRLCIYLATEIEKGTAQREGTLLPRTREKEKDLSTPSTKMTVSVADESAKWLWITLTNFAYEFF